MIVIPAIDIMEGEVVRLYKGDPDQKTVYSTDPVSVARRWEGLGAQMIHVVDLDATLSLGNNIGVIKDISKAVSVPIQAAGGLRTTNAAENMLNYVSRIVIGTLAFDHKSLQNLARFGSRTVVSVDHRKGMVVTHGWRRDSGVSLHDAIDTFVGLGITEFLVTDVSRDGTLTGPDTDGLRAVCGRDDIRVLASGGISSVSDVAEMQRAGAYGTILGKALYEKIITLEDAIRCSQKE